MHVRLLAHEQRRSEHVNHFALLIDTDKTDGQIARSGRSNLKVGRLARGGFPRHRQATLG
jgi:hypothetical protein